MHKIYNIVLLYNSLILSTSFIFPPLSSSIIELFSYSCPNMKIMQHIVDQMSMTHRRLDLVFIHTYARLLHAFFSFFFLFVCNNLYEALGWSIWGLSHLCVRPRSLYSSIHLYNLSSGERERERERERKAKVIAHCEIGGRASPAIMIGCCGTPSQCDLKSRPICRTENKIDTFTIDEKQLHVQWNVVRLIIWIDIYPFFSTPHLYKPR